MSGNADPDIPDGEYIEAELSTRDPERGKAMLEVVLKIFQSRWEPWTRE